MGLKTRIEITNICGSKCWYCYTDKGNKTMSIDTFTGIIEKLKEIYIKGNYNRFKLGFSGGDPFINEFILDAHCIVKDIFGEHLDYTYSTVCNSSNMDIVDKYLNLGKNENNNTAVYISTNEHPTEDIEYQIQYLKSRNHRLGIFFLITDYNIKRLDVIIDLIKRYNLVFRFNTLHDCNMIVTPEVHEAVDKIFKNLTIYKDKHIGKVNPFYSCMNIRNKTTSYCGYGKDYYHFNVDGEVSNCQCEEPITNYKDPNMEEWIKKETYIKECVDCEVFYLCRGGCFVANKNKNWCELYKQICSYIKKV